MLYRSFDEARNFARSLKLASQVSWRKYCKSGQKPDDIPSSPDSTYKNNGWINWSDWLETNNKGPREHTFLPFEEARKYVHSLKLSGRKDWRRF